MTGAKGLMGPKSLFLALSGHLNNNKPKSISCERAIEARLVAFLSLVVVFLTSLMVGMEDGGLWYATMDVMLRTLTQWIEKCNSWSFRPSECCRLGIMKCGCGCWSAKGSMVWRVYASFDVIKRKKTDKRSNYYYQCIIRPELFLFVKIKRKTKSWVLYPIKARK